MLYFIYLYVCFSILLSFNIYNVCENFKKVLIEVRLFDTIINLIKVFMALYAEVMTTYNNNIYGIKYGHDFSGENNKPTIW